MNFHSSADDALKAFVASGRSAIFWPIDMPQYPSTLEFHFKCDFPIFTQKEIWAKSCELKMSKTKKKAPSPWVSKY